MTLQEQKKFSTSGVELHPESDFDGMRKAGLLAAQTLDMITEHVVPGVTTEELDRLCHLFVTKNGAIPAPFIMAAIQPACRFQNPSALL